MTPGIPTLRSSRSVRGRSKCAVPGLAKPPAMLCDEADVRRLMAAHLQRLGRTPWIAREQACLSCHTQQLADGLVADCSHAASGFDWGRPVPTVAPAHLPRFLDAELREMWLVQLWHAFDDARFPVLQRPGFWTWAEALSMQLMSVEVRKPLHNRYPFAMVQAWFADKAEA